MQRFKVLIIDDDARIIDTLTKILPQYNIHVISTDNGYDGIRIAIHEQPKLILLDYIMPDMNGLETFNQLQKNHQTAHITVIMMSSQPLNNTVPCNFLSKPFYIKKLINIISYHQNQVSEIL